MEAAGAPQDPETTAVARKRSGAYSGRLLLRMPASLHADLARASERAGTSLNAFINDALAQTIGRGATASRPAVRPQTGRRRVLERLLVLNVIVLAAVGVLAVALLIEALR
jgi:hypothetical protein